MLSRVRNLFRPAEEVATFSFARPLVLLHSDDWGRVGVRDREGYELLRQTGLRMGEHPYDLYSLETAEDVNEVVRLLRQHRDSVGRSPCLVMNMCTANLDFTKMRSEGFQSTHLLPLAAGLPGQWSRPGLLDAYRSGMKDGVLFPGLHGTSHFCPQAVSNALAEGGERAALLRSLWEADTPYIYWRMPWVGYEYWNPEKPHAGFLPGHRQRTLITQASENFFEIFRTRPITACAPGYRSNRDTCRAWADAGVRIAVNGTGDGLRSPEIDDLEILHVYRAIDFEPSQRFLEIDKYLEIAGACVARGLPVVISVHSINFHSTIKDFRSSTLFALDRILTALESRYPEMLYVNDQDLYRIVTLGVLDSAAGSVKVSARRQNSKARAAEAGAR